MHVFVLTSYHILNDSAPIYLGVFETTKGAIAGAYFEAGEGSTPDFRADESGALTWHTGPYHRYLITEVRLRR